VVCGRFIYLPPSSIISAQELAVHQGSSHIPHVFFVRRSIFANGEWWLMIVIFCF